MANNKATGNALSFYAGNWTDVVRALRGAAQEREGIHLSAVGDGFISKDEVDTDQMKLSSFVHLTTSSTQFMQHTLWVWAVDLEALKGDRVLKLKLAV